MPILQIRDVPEDTVRRLKAKAALQGVSLSEYLRSQLETLAERPSLEEYLRRIRRLDLRVGAPLDAAEIIRESRAEMDEKWDGLWP